MRVYFLICLVIFDSINFSLQIAKIDPECRKLKEQLIGHLKECMHIGCEADKIFSRGMCPTPKDCNPDDFRTAEIWYPQKEYPDCCRRNSCTKRPFDSKQGELLEPYDPGFV